MEVIAWAILGALIGFAASQRKGFSVVGALLGGAFLGPLAFLMFFVSGISKGDQARKCPHCAEFVKIDARVCKHCHRDLPANPFTSSKGHTLGQLAVWILLAVGGFFALGALINLLV